MPFYRCPDCPYTSRSADQANAHRLRHRGVRPFSCPRVSCTFRTDLRASLVRHAARHGQHKPPSCPQCPYRAWGLFNLRKHVKEHVSWDKCQICDATFDTKQQLLDHGASEHGAVKFTACPCCDKFFTGKARHVETCTYTPRNKDDKLSTDKKDVSTAVVKTEVPIERETHMFNEYGKMIRTSEVRYSCDICNYTTRRKRYLTSHMRSHEPEASYKCHICSFRSRYRESLRAHVRRHSQRLPYQCMLCDEMFLSENLLQKHVALVHDKLPVLDHTCEFCRKQFTKVAHLTRHASTCHERPSSNVKVEKDEEDVSVEQFKCETCGLVCNSSFSLTQHALSHAESVQKPHLLVCGACPFACSTSAALYRHARVHAARRAKGKHAARDKEAKKQECSMCQQSFPSRMSLRVHVRSAHAALMRYQCPWCEARYCSGGGYYPHMRTCRKRPVPESEQHKEEIKKDTSPQPPIKKDKKSWQYVKKDTRMAKESVCAYVCEICGQILGSKNSHEMHMNRHAGKRRMYSCGRCPYSSAYSEVIRAHRLRHDGLKPYACSLCPYRTDMKSSLAVHARIHAGDLRHVCRLCPFRAINISNLKRHMAKHTHVRPYQCQQCDKNYFDKKSLSDHIACKHEGVKPYSCPLCAVLFSSLKGQRRHLAKFHPGAPKGSGRATGAPLEGQIQEGSQIGEQIANQTTGQLGTQLVELSTQIGGQLETQTGQLENQIGGQLDAHIGEELETQIGGQL